MKTEPSNNKIFIGASWPYANGNIHLGHLAGQYVVCDVFARYHRQRGNKVLLVSGSDSHGAPVIFAAEDAGIPPEKLAEESHKKIVETYKALGLLYENYTTTRTDNHRIVSQNIFLVLEKLGFLKVKTARQYYDPKAERFLPDRYVRGTCPKCGATNARGDECPECGEFLDPTDLVEPYSTLSDTKPVLKETKHFYLDLARVEDDLKDWLKDKDHWRKWVREFTRGWLEGGLEPRAVTRDFSFGVPVPIKGWEEKVLYVWLEAVVGYLSAAVEWAEKQGDPSAWESFWKDSDCRHYYFIAGGNVPFHTIIWPAELIGYNEKFEDDTLWNDYKLPGETTRKPLVLPYDVPANNNLTYRGKKMSKGDKVGITLETLLDTYHPDVIRYFFTRYAPENQNREFTWKDFIDANNNELVANLGNFINRVLTFTDTRFDGTVPEGTLAPEVNDAIRTAFSETGEHLENCRFVKATESILELGHFANKYFNDMKPWETIKKDKKSAAQTIFNSLQIVQALQTLIKPLLPFSSEKLGNMLNTPVSNDPNKELEQKGRVETYTDGWVFAPLPDGHKLEKPDILFTKLEYTEALQKEDSPEPETYVTTEDIPQGVSAVHENVIIGEIRSLEDIPDKPGIKIAEIETKEPTPRKIVCGAPNINAGDVVPVATPGTIIKTPDGDSVTIREKKLYSVVSEGMLCSQLELGAGEDHSGIWILPKALAKYKGQPLSSLLPVSFVKDENLSDIPTAWAVFEDLPIKQKPSGKLEKWLKSQQKDLKRSVINTNWRDNEVHGSYRKLHEKHGAGRIPGSPEEILSYIEEKGSIPNINTFVDLYNMFSAITGISIGAHDIENIDGKARLVILSEDVPFKHAATNKEDVAKKGEFAYVDDTGILCRLDIKQASRTSVRKDTRHVLLLFQGNNAVEQQYLDEKIEEFKRLVNTFIQE
jgi:methionyl-tRNA synthetase